jgi:hypothetical protein
MQKSVKSVEIGRAHVARDFEVGYDSNPPSGRFNLFLGSGAPSAQRFWLHESFSFVNPTTFTTLPVQQCRCAFSFHSLALCRHSYACFIHLLLLASTLRLAFPLRLFRLRHAVLSTAMDSFPFPEHISSRSATQSPQSRRLKGGTRTICLSGSQKLPKLLKGDDPKKLKEGRIDGVIFLNHAGDMKYFREECNLPIGTSEMLADLAKEIAGAETAGMKSKLLSFISCT